MVVRTPLSESQKQALQAQNRKQNFDLNSLQGLEQYAQEVAAREEEKVPTKQKALNALAWTGKQLNATVVPVAAGVAKVVGEASTAITGQETKASKTGYFDLVKDYYQNTDSFSRAMRDAAVFDEDVKWQRYASNIVGFGADVFFDPANLLTFGTAGIAKKGLALAPELSKSSALTRGLNVISNGGYDRGSDIYKAMSKDINSFLKKNNLKGQGTQHADDILRSVAENGIITPKTMTKMKNFGVSVEVMERLAKNSNNLLDPGGLKFAQIPIIKGKKVNDFVKFTRIGQLGKLISMNKYSKQFKSLFIRGAKLPKNVANQFIKMFDGELSVSLKETEDLIEEFSNVLNTLPKEKGELLVDTINNARADVLKFGEDTAYGKQLMREKLANRDIKFDDPELDSIMEELFYKENSLSEKLGNFLGIPKEEAFAFYIPNRSIDDFKKAGLLIPRDLKAGTKGVSASRKYRNLIEENKRMKDPLKLYSKVIKEIGKGRAMHRIEAGIAENFGFTKDKIKQLYGLADEEVDDFAKNTLGLVLREQKNYLSDKSLLVSVKKQIAETEDFLKDLRKEFVRDIKKAVKSNRRDLMTDAMAMYYDEVQDSISNIKLLKQQKKKLVSRVRQSKKEYKEKIKVLNEKRFKQTAPIKNALEKEKKNLAGIKKIIKDKTELFSKRKKDLKNIIKDYKSNPEIKNLKRNERLLDKTNASISDLIETIKEKKRLRTLQKKEKEKIIKSIKRLKEKKSTLEKTIQETKSSKHFSELTDKIRKKENLLNTMIKSFNEKVSNLNKSRVDAEKAIKLQKNNLSEITSFYENKKIELDKSVQDVQKDKMFKEKELDRAITQAQNKKKSLLEVKDDIIENIDDKKIKQALVDEYKEIRDTFKIELENLKKIKKTEADSKIKFSYYIDPQLNEAITSEMTRFSKSENPIKELWNGYLNMTKAWLYNLFPASHIRNITSAQFMLLNEGILFGNGAQNAFRIANKKFTRQYKNAAGELVQEPIVLTNKLGDEITLEELYDKLRNSSTMFSKGIYSDAELGSFVDSALTNPIGAAIKSGFKAMGRHDLANQAAGIIPMTQEFGRNSELILRLTGAINGWQRGMGIEGAVKATEKALFDYSKLTQFEREWMKSLIPFYTFARKNFEYWLNMMYERPGKVSANLRAMRTVKDLMESEADTEEEGLPPWVYESMHMNTGKVDKYGRPIYLTGFGLPIEEFFGNFSGTRSTMGNFTSNLFGRLAPAGKWILERQFDKDIFRDKELIELDNAEGLKEILDIAPPKVRKELADFMKLRQVGTRGVYVEGEKVGEEPRYKADPYALHTLRSLPTARVMSTMEGLLQGDINNRYLVLKYLTGIKGYAFDIEQQKYFEDLSRKEELTRWLFSIDPAFAQFQKYYLRKDQ